MPTINIKELDKTSAVASAVDNNVVYVPGFSAKVISILREHTKKDASGTEVKIPNAIIFDESGAGVEVAVPVFYGLDKQKAYNIADRISWECTSGTQTVANAAAGAIPADVEYVEILSSQNIPNNWNDLLPYLYIKKDSNYVAATSTFQPGTTYYLAKVASYTFKQEVKVNKVYYDSQVNLTWINRSVNGVAVKDASTDGIPTFENLTIISGKIASLEAGQTGVSLNTTEAFIDAETSQPIYTGQVAYADTDNGNDGHTITLNGTLTPEDKVYFMPAVVNPYISDNSDITTVYSKLDYQYTASTWKLREEEDYDAPSINEAVEFTATTKEQDFIDAFGGAPYIFSEAQPYPVNGANSFSELAYSTNNDVIVEKGSPDKSYIYARELLNSGLSVIYEAVVELADSTEESSLVGYPAGAKQVKLPSVQYLYKRFTGDENNDNIFKALTDKGTHNIKFITSGGYPTFEYGGNVAVAAMNTAAVDRGDVVVLIDPTDYPGRTLKPAKNSGSVFDVVNNSKNDSLLSLQGPTSDKGGAYATMVPVWIKYTAPTYGALISMPGSFAYLISYANSVRTYADWLAIAGVARGIIPNCQGINSFHVLTNSIAEAYQTKTGISINPITYIRGYGYALWGNRTLLNNNGLTASSFLNLRSLICDVKKTVYAACRRYMFEQNNDVLWVSFKAAITPTLEKMVAGYGIESYKIVKLPTREKAKIVAEIILTPIYAVEDFEVTIVLTDSELTVE